MAKRPTTPPVDPMDEIRRRITADPNLLSDAEKEAASNAARENIRAARKQKATEEYIASEMRRIERELEPSQELVYVLIDLPGHAFRIVLDDVAYYHGVQYPVVPSVVATLLDIQARAWEHEHEINGANRDEYNRRPSGRMLRPGMENMSTSQLLRSTAAI